MEMKATDLPGMERSEKEKAALEKKLAKFEKEAATMRAALEELEKSKLYLRAFEWRFEFPEALDNDGNFIGFDVIVGNPPYIRPHNLSTFDKEYFWEHYKTFTHKADIYCCFIERASSLLKTDGLFSYITSRGWLHLNSFQVLRRHFLENYTIKTLADFPYNVFESATVSTTIFVSRKTPAASNHLIQVIKGGHENGKAQFSHEGMIPQAAFETTFENVFDLSISPETDGIKNKMRGGSKIGDHFQICFGLKTGDDKEFLHKEHRRNPEDRCLLRGDDIKRYAVHYKGEYVWYVPEQMRQHKPTARPGEAARFEQPKVLVKDTSKDFGCTYDDENYYVKDVLVVIPKQNTTASTSLSLLTLTGILNSKLMKFYYRTTFPTLHVQAGEVADLPLPEEISQAQQQTISSLVENILTAKRQGADTDTSALEAKIDRHVYSLYNLLPDEIKIVEGKLLALSRRN